MSIRNKVQLVGHTGQNPEIKSFGESGKLAKFSVATTESYKDSNGEWKETTTWHNITAWGSLADRAERQIHKGSSVLIEGKLVNRDYTGSDNVKRYITEIQAESFLVLDKKNGNPDTEKVMETSTKDFYKTSSEDEDLPF